MFDCSALSAVSGVDFVISRDIQAETAVDPSRPGFLAHVAAESQAGARGGLGGLTTRA